MHKNVVLSILFYPQNLKKIIFLGMKKTDEKQIFFNENYTGWVSSSFVICFAKNVQIKVVGVSRPVL